MLIVPKIESIEAKKLIGISKIMSLQQNTTGLLWKELMQRRLEIKNAINTDLYSVQIYDPSYFLQFNPSFQFEKWAAIEVFSQDSIPPGMRALIIPAGLYAIFHYTGNPVEGGLFFEMIFKEWLPHSGYSLDTRPHFEILGDKYRNNDPASEEDIYIPIK